MQRADDGADTELPLEAECHVGQDQQEREQDGERTLLREFLADLGPTTSVRRSSTPGS